MSRHESGRALPAFWGQKRYNRKSFKADFSKSTSNRGAKSATSSRLVTFDANGFRSDSELEEGK